MLTDNELGLHHLFCSMSQKLSTESSVALPKGVSFNSLWALRIGMLDIGKLCQTRLDDSFCMGLGVVAMNSVFTRKGNTLRVLATLSQSALCHNCAIVS